MKDQVFGMCVCHHNKYRCKNSTDETIMPKRIVIYWRQEMTDDSFRWPLTVGRRKMKDDRGKWLRFLPWLTTDDWRTRTFWLCCHCLADDLVHGNAQVAFIVDA